MPQASPFKISIGNPFAITHRHRIADWNRRSAPGGIPAGAETIHYRLAVDDDARGVIPRDIELIVLRKRGSDLTYPLCAVRIPAVGRGFSAGWSQGLLKIPTIGLGSCLHRSGQQRALPLPDHPQNSTGPCGIRRRAR